MIVFLTGPSKFMTLDGHSQRTSGWRIKGGMAQRIMLKTAIFCHVKRDIIRAANSSCSFLCDHEHRSKATWHSAAILPNRRPFILRVAKWEFGVPNTARGYGHGVYPKNAIDQSFFRQR